jgi:hypothetical protein
MYNSMTTIYQRVLTLAGYEGDPSEQNVIDCFLDYVDSGAFLDLDYDSARQDIENGDITIDQICHAMLRILR